jgi:hypothetical protein
LKKQNPQSFDFGTQNQQSLFDLSGGSISGDAPTDHVGESGSVPTPSLQLLTPKELRIETISRQTARRIWLELHYLQRDFSNPSLELGVFDRKCSELVGAIAFSARLGGSKKGGAPHCWEIRRMWLSDTRCSRNCESRVLAISCRIIVPRVAPHVRQIISYSDLEKQGHKGTIYKAAGFSYHGMTAVDPDGQGWGSHASHQVKDNWAKRRWILNLYEKD